MTTFKERLVVELQELSDKLNKLQSFMKGDAFKTIDPAQAELLVEQEGYMASYADVLQRRLDLL